MQNSDLVCKEQDELRRNFLENYIEMKSVLLKHGERKRYLGGTVDRKCRYCKRRETETTFRKVAHVIPAQIGNRTLLDNNECDICNEHFGNFLEDSFAKYLLPYRSFFRTMGRVKIPTHDDPDLRVSTVDGHLQISLKNFDELDSYRARIGTNLLKFSAIRQPYYPTSVHKTFIKIALAFMPDSERFNAETLLAWILQPNYSPLFEGPPIFQWEVPGPLNPNIIRCSLFKARPDCELRVFKYILILAFGNIQYQVVVPSIDEHGINKKLPVGPVTVPNGLLKYGRPSLTELQLTSEDIVRDDLVSIYIHYSELEEM